MSPTPAILGRVCWEGLNTRHPMLELPPTEPAEKSSWIVKSSAQSVPLDLRASCKLTTTPMKLQTVPLPIGWACLTAVNPASPAMEIALGL